MKKILLFTFIAVFACIVAHAQGGGVSINTSGTPANPSAMLDISSSNSGILIPRMTTAERNNISAPVAEGLLIFNTTTKCFEAYVANTWSALSCPANCFPPGTPGVISGASSMCDNSTSSYSIGQVNSATTYTWTLPAGWAVTSGQGTTQINVLTGAVGQNGTISVTANNTCGASSASNFGVSVTGTPAAAGVISGTSVVCQGQNSIIYTVPPITYATNYIWTLPTGATGSSTSNSITVSYGTTAQSGNISVAGNNSACGNGVSSSLAVTVNPLPANPAAITGATVVCQGQNSVVYSVNPIANATSYVWTIPSGASGSSTTSSITVNYGASAISGNVSVKGNNSCGDGETSSLYVTVNPLPGDAGVISGLNNVCQGELGVVYSLPAISNATSYTWTLPAGASGSSTTNSISVNFGMSSVVGNITVTGNNSCGSGAASSLAITGNCLVFNPTGTGQNGSIQSYVVPAGVTSLTIEAWGAQGGKGSSTGNAGLGARMKGDFTVTPGETFSILVGQQGSANQYSGSGGGGTFVVNSSNTPLLVAGGGGGGAWQTAAGQPGLTTTSGGAGFPSGGSGGTAGSGGVVGGTVSAGWGGGGGGFSGNGGDHLTNGGGRSFLNGGTGGEGYFYGSGLAVGGYGGGGGNGNHGGGGGGGYSGGGAGESNMNGGGGGGSYNAGSNQSNTSGVQTGHGKVKITW